MPGREPVGNDFYHAFPATRTTETIDRIKKSHHGQRGGKSRKTAKKSYSGQDQEKTNLSSYPVDDQRSQKKFAQGIGDGCVTVDCANLRLVHTKRSLKHRHRHGKILAAKVNPDITQNDTTQLQERPGIRYLRGT